MFRKICRISKNNPGSINPKEGKTPAPNPASIYLFVDSEAVTRPNSTDVEDLDLDDSVTDVAYIPLPESTSESESEGEDDPEISPLVKFVKKSVKAGLKK